MTYLLDTNAISELMRAAPQVENWMAGLDQGDRVVTCMIVRGEISAKYCSGLPDFREADGARSWRRPAASFWILCTANQSRNGQATFTWQLSWLANSAASPWTKTTYGWLRRRSLSVRHWSAATVISEALTACASLRWSSR